MQNERKSLSSEIYDLIVQERCPKTGVLPPVVRVSDSVSQTFGVTRRSTTLHEEIAKRPWLLVVAAFIVSGAIVGMASYIRLTSVRYGAVEVGNDVPTDVSHYSVSAPLKAPASSGVNLMVADEATSVASEADLAEEAMVVDEAPVPVEEEAAIEEVAAVEQVIESVPVEAEPVIEKPVVAAVIPERNEIVEQPKTAPRKTSDIAATRIAWAKRTANEVEQKPETVTQKVEAKVEETPAPVALPEPVVEKAPVPVIEKQVAAAPVALEPKAPMTYKELMAQARKRGPKAKRIEYFRSALRLNPGSDEAMASLSTMMMENPSTRSEALSLAKKAVSRNPDNARAWLSIGYIHQLNGAQKDSKKAYKKCASCSGPARFVRDCSDQL
jgi:hypothetical protein